MRQVRRGFALIDRWQRRHRSAAVSWAVIRKFGNDQANLLVVALGWYGFTAIYPLLLVVITVFGYIGQASLGHGIVSTLHQFPVIGAQFNPGRPASSLHGSIVGLVIGVVGLIYGAQGVTQTAESAMCQVWNVPRYQRPGFFPALGRSLLGLVAISLAFVVNASAGSIASGYGQSIATRVPIIVGMLVINVGFYLAAFRALTPGGVTTKSLLPGAMVGAVGFTFLITLGTGLVEHQLRHTTATYGAFASVIGVVTFLLLLSKVSVYAAELNPVLDRKLWPRAMPTVEPTEADRRVLRDLVHEERRREDQTIGVGFGEDSEQQVSDDAYRSKLDQEPSRPRGNRSETQLPGS